MSLVENKTVELFSAFMPRRKEIPHPVHTSVWDLKEYGKDYFVNYHPSKSFTKWALIEVSAVENIPEGMEVFVLQAGEYAVFFQKELNTEKNPFEYIFTKWIPGSDYILDDRPHFDVLAVTADKKQAETEQEFWIPIRKK